MSLFEKRIRNNENDINIRYYTEEDLNREEWNKINKKINKVLENIMDISAENIISIMRTILKNYKEEYFELIITEKDKGKYYIRYIDKTLDIYKRNIDNELTNLELAYYNKNNNFAIEYNNDSFDLNKLEKISTLISNETKYISKLIKINSKELTIFDKRLIAEYKLFYKELPDFTSLDIERKYQNMIYILNNYSITNLLPITDFYKKDNKINSNTIKNWLVNIKTFIDNYNININESFNEYLSLEEIKKIEFISNEITNYTNNEITELLDRICEILYEYKNNWNLVTYNKTKSSKNDEYKLIKRIDEKLNRN